MKYGKKSQPSSSWYVQQPNSSVSYSIELEKQKVSKDEMATFSGSLMKIDWLYILKSAPTKDIHTLSH
jgi:hypothetical protein